MLVKGTDVADGGIGKLGVGKTILPFSVGGCIGGEKCDMLVGEIGVWPGYNPGLEASSLRLGEDTSVRGIETAGFGGETGLGCPFICEGGYDMPVVEIGEWFDRDPADETPVWPFFGDMGMFVERTKLVVAGVYVGEGGGMPVEEIEERSCTDTVWPCFGEAFVLVEEAIPAGFDSGRELGVERVKTERGSCQKLKNLVLKLSGNISIIFSIILPAQVVSNTFENAWKNFKKYYVKNDEIRCAYDAQ